MSDAASEAVEAVRATLAALVVDPGIKVTSAWLGDPADPAALAAWRGRVPDDLLDVLAILDGVDIAWEAEEPVEPDGQERGMLRLTRLAALAVVEAGADRYALIDGRTRGMGSYYRLHGDGVTAPDVVYTLRGDEPRQAETVCETAIEYLALAARHRFAASWTDDVAYQRHRAIREADRRAAERAVEALGAEAWRTWRDALWGSDDDIAAIAPRFRDADLAALIDAGEQIADGLGRLALHVPALVPAILADARPRLRRTAIAAWAAAGRSPLSPEQLAALGSDADAGVRLAAAKLRPR